MQALSTAATYIILQRGACLPGASSETTDANDMPPLHCAGQVLLLGTLPWTDGNRNLVMQASLQAARTDVVMGSLHLQLCQSACETNVATQQPAYTQSTQLT